jgi:rhodanese-related sulfurtransferase
MPSTTSITIDKLARLVGTPKCPAVVDVRTDEDLAADPRLIPGSQRRAHASVSQWAADFAGRAAITVCQRGQKLSEGAAAWLRHEGLPAESLAGGFEAWQEAGLPLLPLAKLPPRDACGRTVWVTRARPKIDRIACPWLIRRFVDPEAESLYAPADRVLATAGETGAIPFDVPNVEFGHEGERCSFDAFLRRFGLEGADPALDRLALIVRGADTGRPELTPQSPGLLALSAGLSATHPDDHAMLAAGMVLYDALYAWCRRQGGAASQA